MNQNIVYSSENSTETHSEQICYVVSYDHGGLVLWGYGHFIQHFREMLGWLDRHPELKMGLDNEAWMYEWLAYNQPVVLRELKDALIKYKGRLGLSSCTYGQPLAAFLLEESNIRQIQYGIETTKQFLGYQIEFYSFSEHAAFAQLPQIAVGFGLKGALMRTHYLMYGICPGYDLPAAWWKSPDGSRIACVPTYINQERQVPNHTAHPPGPFGLTTEDTWILTRYPSAISPHPLETFVKRFHHINPLVATRLDDSGLKREELVYELADNPTFQWATIEDVFGAMPEPNQTIQPTSEDFRTRMPWGYRGNFLFDLARRAEIMVLTAERMPTKSDKSHDYFRGTTNLAWKNLLVAQHHDVQIVARSGTMGHEFLTLSIHNSSMLIRVLLQSKLDRSGYDGCFAAFNPLPWQRTEMSAKSPDGTLIPGPITSASLGYDNFISKPEEQVEEELHFETDFYKVQLCQSGGVASLQYKDGTEVFNSGHVSIKLAGVIDGVASVSQAITVRLVRSTAGFILYEQGKIASIPYTLTVHFPQHGERLDVQFSARFDGESIGAPTTEKRDSRSCFQHEQKLRIQFYPNVNRNVCFGIYDVPFGISTTERQYVEGNYWTALADNIGGLCIANRGTMGTVREEDGAFSVPVAFTTNYVWGMEMINGEREWEVGIIPFRGWWQEAALHRKALEFAFPIVAVPGHISEEATSSGLFSIDEPDLHLTALFYSENGSICARFVNMSDKEIVFDGTKFPAETMIKYLNLWNEIRTDLEQPHVPNSDIVFKPWQNITLQISNPMQDGE